MKPRPTGSQSGFTLAEAIIVIVITAIIGVAVAVFIKSPVQAYFDTARRAELTDIADTALRRMARDINAALPNSVRVITPSSTRTLLEFVPIKGAGRYRAETGSAVTDDPLDFTSADSSFDVLGPMVSISRGDSIVIYNLGIPGSDAYENATTSSRRVVTAPFGAALAQVNFTAGGSPFPLASPSNRFHIVGTPVTYECAPDSANPTNGFLRRYSGYAFQNTQPSSFTAAGIVSAVLATNVSDCSIQYLPAVYQRNGLVSIRLLISKDNETVTLQHQVNVNNTP